MAADFKDVINKLEENKSDNRAAIEAQTTSFAESFKQIITSQNRSFGQSLSLQFTRQNNILSEMLMSLKESSTIEGSTLTDIHESLEKSFKVNEKMALEQERLRLLSDTTGQFTSKDDSEKVKSTEKGDGKKLALLAGAGALAGAALKGVAGIALMGAAIAAFFGGLVLGNNLLGQMKEAGFDFDFQATKKAAKGFSEIVQELSPEGMIALGGIVGAAAVASKGGGGGVGGATKMALGVGLMGAAITAFFGGLLLGDAVLEGISALTGGTDFNGFKSVVAGFDSVISEMSPQTMIVLGSLIGAATVASFKTSLKGQAMGLAIASLGIAITAFFGGLVAGSALLENVDVLSGSLNLEGLKTVVGGFGDIVNSLDTQTLAALGVLFGLSFITSFTSKASVMKIALGMTAIGAGITGFFAGLALGDAAMSFLGTDFTALPAAIESFGNAIGNLSDQALIALGALLGAGGLIGTIGSPAKVALGMGAVGAGIAAFLMAFSAADFVAANVGTGESLVTLMTNFSAAISALDTTALTAISVLLGAGALFGATGMAGPAALGMGLIGAGIAAFFLAFDGLAKVGNVIGVDGSSTKELIGNMVDGVKKLNQIDAENLSKLTGPLAKVGPAILAFMGSDGIAGAATFVTDKVKGFFSFLFGGDEEAGPKRTIIDEMVDMLKPVEQLNDVNLDGFIAASNALTDFVNNDYRGGADDFEYFVNKMVELTPLLEGAVFGGMSVDGVDVMGLANGGDGYIQAQKNIQALKNALSDNQTELSQSQANGANAAPIIVSNDQSQQVVNNTNSKASITLGKNTNPPDKTLNAINSFYEADY